MNIQWLGLRPSQIEPEEWLEEEEEEEWLEEEEIEEEEELRKIEEKEENHNFRSVMARTEWKFEEDEEQEEEQEQQQQQQQEQQQGSKKGGSIKVTLPRSVSQLLSQADVEKIKTLLSNHPYIKINKNYQRELSCMLKTGRKYELEALMSQGFDYLSREFLLKAILMRDYI